MKEIQYKKFSWNTHRKNWLSKRPSVCQLELTFGCNLHCNYCYTDCYNQPAYLRKELKTQEVKSILDKIYKAGIIWICFTGGDPLTRRDFLDIYSYAKEKGFIITLFTNGCSINEEIIRHFKERPPFVIEMTLNAVREDTYEKISQVKDLFNRTMKGIKLILKHNLPLKIKTQVTKDNLRQIPEIKKFIQGLGLKFVFSPDLHTRLNGDFSPVLLRISSQEVLNLYGRKQSLGNDYVGRKESTLCRHIECTENEVSNAGHRASNTELFRCAIGGGDGIHIDPYGNIFPCTLIREPAFNLLEVEFKQALNNLLTLVKNREFITESKCNGCSLRKNCRWCPGRAYIETSDMEKPIGYYCELARLMA